MFLVMTKFFLWSYLKDFRSLEEIAGFLSLGTMLAFFVGWALSYAFKKKWIVIAAALLAIWSLLYGHYFGYKPYVLFATLLALDWVMYGLWQTIKWIIVTTEIQESKLSETVINWLTNVALLWWMLIWSYFGFAMYDKRAWMWVWWIVAVLTLTCILALFLWYDKRIPTHSIIESIKRTAPEIWFVVKKYFRLLIPIWILRATSTAMAQKMLEIWIDTFNRTPTKSIIVIVLSMAWIITWHIISVFFKRRNGRTLVLLTILFWVCVLFFPSFLRTHETYKFVKLYSLWLWVILWIIVNILEARFFHLIWDDHEKEYWSAAYWIVTNIIMFGTMLGTSTIEKHYNIRVTFTFFGIAILFSAIWIRKLKNS